MTSPTSADRPDMLTTFARFNPDIEWLQRYLSHIDSAPHPIQKPIDAHHILPTSLFPEFASFRLCPWNRRRFSPFDHVVAHYYLCKALPSNPSMRAAFVLMVGRRVEARPILHTGSRELLEELAAEYQRVREQGDLPTIKGRIRIHKEGTRSKAVPVESLDNYLLGGWTTDAPKREWMYKGRRSKRVLLDQVGEQRLEGWEIGRPGIHTPESKEKISYASRTRDQRFPGRDWSLNLKRGAEHHMFGKAQPKEVREKISTSLTGIKQTMETIQKRREAMLRLGPALGERIKEWWIQERRETKSRAMMGDANNRFGQPGPWRGKKMPESMRRKMSAAYKANLAVDPEMYTRSLPRGEKHWTYGKPRSPETCARITESLTGKKQSPKTKKKRSESLALSKMPTFVSADEDRFRSLMLAKTSEERSVILSAIKGIVPRQIAKGIITVMEQKSGETKRRYWVGAHTWMKFKSGYAHLIEAEL